MPALCHEREGNQERLLLLLLCLIAPPDCGRRTGAATLAQISRAPRGWNSFDNSGTANESQVYAAIAALQHGVLGPTNETGFEFVEMDGFWFSSHIEANSESLDSYGRPCPGPDKYPSLNCSLKPLADAAHAAGLKLGIWQLFGVPKGAVARKLPIFGTHFTAADIALEHAPNCGWAAWEGFAVNHSHPGAQAWYDSLASLWSEWGLDLIKLDCVFGGNWTPQTCLEIEAVSRAIDKVPRALALSLSPGGAVTAPKLDKVTGLATTARIAVDLHGEFSMIYPQYFDIAAQWHARVPNATRSNATTTGLFLDLGILPFGQGKDMHLTTSEMRVVMTLWCLLRSPLIFGGAIAGANAVDSQVRSIVTNADMLRITDDVQQPTLLPSQHDHIVTWMAFSASDPLTVRYVAVFNLGQKIKTENKTQRAFSADPRALSCVGTAFRNDTCFHNPRGKLVGMAVDDAQSCCEACSNYTQPRRCVAWSAFHDGSTLECFLFGSIGKVNYVKGCVSSAGTPAPAPAPFSGQAVSLKALQLDESQAWTARSVWDAGQPATPVVNGSFVSRPSYHDVAMYVVASSSP